MNLRKRVVMDETTVKDLLNEEVKIPVENISDIILKNETEFFNLMSGEKGNLKNVARKGITPVVIDTDLDYFLEDTRGIYAAPSKQADALIVLRCVLKKKEDGTYGWVEEKNEEEKVSSTTTRTLVSKSFIIKDMKPIDLRFKLVEICGGNYYGAFYSLLEKPKTALYTGVLKTILDYLGGAVVGYDEDNGTYVAGNPIHIINMLTSSECDATYGVEEYGFFPDPGKVPADIMDKLNVFCTSLDMQAVYSYLQRMDIGFIQRDFVAIRFRLPDGNDKYEFFEVQRILLSANNFKNAKNLWQQVFWYDGYREETAEKPFIGHAQGLLDYALDIYWDCIEVGKPSYATKRFAVNTGFEETNLTHSLCAMTENRVVSKIMNTNMTMPALKRFLVKFKPEKYRYNPDLILPDVFGTMNEAGETVDEMLCLPEGMFDYIASLECDFQVIARCKRLFGYNNTKYLMNLSREDYTFLVTEMLCMSNKKLNWTAKRIAASGAIDNWKVFLAA